MGKRGYRMNKHTILFMMLLGSALVTAIPAIAAGNFGLGFVLGDPSGITAKYFLGSDHAIAAGVGDAAGHGLYLNVDYLKHFRGLFPVPEMTFYLGGGGAFHHYHRDRHVRVWDDEDEENRLETRMPFGINYVFKPVPIEAFLELVPALEIVPDVDFRMRAGLGARYYF